MVKRRPRYPSSAQLKDRTAWAKENPICWLCGKPASETHEISSRAQSPNRWAHRCNYFRVDSFSGCHTEAAQMSPARQLAIKGVYDPENLNLEAWLLIRGRGDECVTWRDIALEAMAMLREQIQ
jgi:hypothetical protein